MWNLVLFKLGVMMKKLIIGIAVIFAIALLVYYENKSSDHNQIKEAYKGCDNHGGIDIIKKSGKATFHLVRCKDETVKMVTFSEADDLT